MNKTFNDPNVKYSDQGTPLAQAAEALSTIGEVTEAVDDLEEAVGELSEKVDLIPVPVAADDGKVLTATDDGAYELADVDALPAISAGDAGKVLTVNAGATGAEWAAASGGDIMQLYSATNPTSGAHTDEVVNLANVKSILLAGKIPVIHLAYNNKHYFYYPDGDSGISDSTSVTTSITFRPIMIPSGQSNSWGRTQYTHLLVSATGFNVQNYYVGNPVNTENVPSTNGTYVLKATRGSGSTTFAWVAET